MILGFLKKKASDNKKPEIYHTNFLKCRDLGMIPPEPSFTLSGINYYVLDDNKMPMLRLVALQENMSNYKDFGMSEKTMKSYMQDIDDDVDQIRRNAGDEIQVRDAIESIKKSMDIIKEHIHRVNSTGFLLEMGAVMIVREDEDPYSLDYKMFTTKVEHWSAALLTEGKDAEIFMGFFLKLVSGRSGEWIRQLLALNKQLEDSETEQDRMRITRTQNQIMWDILQQQKQLEESAGNLSLRQVARRYRNMLSLIKFRWSNQVLENM